MNSWIASPAIRPTPHADRRCRLASDGLSLTDDGRVFFNSTDALAPRDLDETGDVYEWEADAGMGPSQTSTQASAAASA